MKHILILLLYVVVITYALRLINASSDLLVFAGLGVVGLTLYGLYQEVSQLFTYLKSRL